MSYVIAQSDVTRYTMGQCHALALVLNELADLPLWGVEWVYEEGPGHCLVLLNANRFGLDDHRFLDVEGEHDMNRWPDAEAVAREDLEDAWNGAYEVPYLDSHTYRVARTLLARYGH